MESIECRMVAHLMVYREDDEGSALSCVNGLWAKFKFNEKIYSVVFESSTTGGGDVYKTLNLGKHLLCVFSGGQSTDMVTNLYCLSFRRHMDVRNEGYKLEGWCSGIEHLVLIEI
jgi:hypothetical protein